MRRFVPLLLAVAGAALLAACETMPAGPPPKPIAAAPPPPPPPPTPAEEFAWSTVPGPNTLIAKVYYQPTPAETWTCAGLGAAVALMPETSYSRGRIQALYGSAQQSIQPVSQVRAKSSANPGADYSQFVKSAACDASDTFTLAALPDGFYFAIVRLRQVKPASGAEMVLMQRLNVRGGGQIHLILPIGAQPPRPAAAPPARPAPGRRAPR